MPHSVAAPSVSLAVRDALLALFASGFEDPFDYQIRNLKTCDAKFFAQPVLNELGGLIGGSIAAGTYARAFTVPTGMTVGTLCYLASATTLAAADATTQSKSSVIGVLRYKPTPSSTSGFIDHLWYQTGVTAGTVGNPVFLKDDASLGPAAGTVRKVVGIYITTTTALCWASPQTVFELRPDNTTIDQSGTAGTLETIRATAANARACTDTNKALTASNLNDYVAVQTLTSSGGSVAFNMALGVNSKHTLTENTTLAAPSNIRAGSSGIMEIIQHASSAKTLAFNSVWKFAGGSAPSISTGLSAKDVLGWYSPDGTNLYAALNKAFA